MPQVCTVAHCTNTSVKVRGVPFFGFPKDEQLRRQWVEAVQIDPKMITKSTKVCFKHFETTDYHQLTTLHKLKKGRVPTLHLPLATTVTSPSEACGNQDMCIIKRQQRGRKRYHRQSPFLIENFMSRDDKISYYTGVQTFPKLRELFEFVSQPESGPSGAVRQGRKHSLSPLNELFLTLIKLRRGFEYDILGDMFLISRTCVCRIFIRLVTLLYTKLTSLDIWPQRDVLLENASPQFIHKYPRVIGTIDCVEFHIEKPSSLVRQSQCYSHYKGITTLKSLVMIDPNGGIIFVSTLFDGSIPDKKLLEESGFCDLLRTKLSLGELQQGDIILTDKGFKVTDIMADIGITLNVPTLRITGKQFGANDAEYIRTIAHGRIDVERAIRRLKAFAILSKRIPLSMLGSINQICTVCAMLTNRFPLR